MTISTNNRPTVTVWQESDQTPALVIVRYTNSVQIESGNNLPEISDDHFEEFIKALRAARKINAD